MSRKRKALFFIGFLTLTAIVIYNTVSKKEINQTEISLSKIENLYNLYVDRGFITKSKTSLDVFKNSSIKQQVILFNLANNLNNSLLENDSFYQFFNTTEFKQFSSIFKENSAENIRLENIFDVLTYEERIDISYDKWLIEINKENNKNACTFCKKNNIYSYLLAKKLTVSGYDTWLENVGLIK